MSDEEKIVAEIRAQRDQEEAEFIPPSYDDLSSLSPEALGTLPKMESFQMIAPPLNEHGRPIGFTDEEEYQWRERQVAWENSLPRKVLEGLRQLGEAEIETAKLPYHIGKRFWTLATDPVKWWEEFKGQFKVSPETRALVDSRFNKISRGETPTEQENEAATEALMSSPVIMTALGAAIGSPKFGRPPAPLKPVRVLRPGEVVPPKVPPKIIIPGEVPLPEVVPKIEIVSKYKQPVPNAVMRASKNFAEGNYKAEILADIEMLPKLPQLSRGVLEWKPNTIGYQNPFTKVTYKGWDKVTILWDRYAPSWAKSFRNRQIAELSLEKNRVLSGMNADVVDNIIKPLRKVSLEQKEIIGLGINKVITIPEAQRAVIQKIDVRIGQLSKAITDKYKSWAKDGHILPEEIRLKEETMLAHLGAYARTRYLRSTGIKGAPSRVVPPKRVSETTIQQSMFKKKLTLEEWGEGKLRLDGWGEGMVKDRKLFPLKEIEEIGLEAKKANGWIYQADVMVDMTFKDLHSNYATMLWQDSIIKDVSLFSRTSKPGFISVSEALPRQVITDRRLGPLNGGYITPALKDEIKLFVRYGEQAPNKILGEALGWWKGAKVAGNPATVVRNYMSGGFIQTDMAGFPVWYPQNTPVYVKSVTNYIGKGKRYDFWRRQGLYGSDYFSVEIDPAFSSGLEQGTIPYTAFGDKMASLSQKTKSKLFNYYGSIDHIHRTYLAEAALKNGANPAQAVHFANKWQLDYRFVAPMIEKARSGAAGFFFPFVSYPALMAPRIAEVMTTRPWVLAKYPIILNMVNEMNRARLGMTEEMIEAAKPDFLKKDPYAVLIGKDENGQPEWWTMGYILPFGSWTTGFQDVEQWGNMMTGQGLAGGITTLATGYDSFMKTKIYNEGDLPSVKREKVGAYALRLFGPGVVGHFLNIYDAINGKMVGFPKKMPRSVRQVILRAAGISIYSGGENTVALKIWLRYKETQDINKAWLSIKNNPNLSAEEKERKKAESITVIKNNIKEIKRLQEILPQLRETLEWNKADKIAEDIKTKREDKIVEEIRAKRTKETE